MNRIRKNFMSFKGRQEPQQGQRIKVYKNLHNGLWSIKDIKTGLVLGHTSEITLFDCEYRVGQKGRERVLNEQQKNVHAFIVGGYMSDVFIPKNHLEGSGMITRINKLETVTYNPYKENHFTTLESNRTKEMKCSEYCTMQAENSLVLSY